MAEYRFNPADLIFPPFRKCPACSADRSYGLLSVFERHCVRRCKKCWHTDSTPLPQLKKTIVYLDQMAISDMMKAINPHTQAHQKGRVPDFYRELFQRLHRLVKLQLVICPDSMAHRTESAIAGHQSALQRMYEALSGGATFHPPDHVRRFQIYDHAMSWLKGAQEYKPKIDVNEIIDGDHNGWLSKLSIGVRWPRDNDYLDEIRQERDRSATELGEIFSSWQREGVRPFRDRFVEEARGFGNQVLCDVREAVMRQVSLRAGFSQLSMEDLMPGPSVVLTHNVQEGFAKNGVTSADVWPTVRKYFQEAPLEEVPSLRICAALFSVMAEQAASGRKRPPNQGTATDVNVISSYLPYCHAMYVDREYWNFLHDNRVQELLPWDTQIFCYRDRDAFLGYLDGIRGAATDEHVDLVTEVYGTSWQEPYTGMFRDRSD